VRLCAKSLLESDRCSPATRLPPALHLGAATALEGSLDLTRHDASGTAVREIPFQVTLLGYFKPDEEISPFLLAGMGWYFRRLGGPGAHSETRCGPHVGAGVQWLIGKHLSMEASYRFLWSAVWRLSDFSHPYGSGFHERGSMLTVRFARAQPLVAALQKRGAIVDFRPPDIVRIAPAPLYNSYSDVQALVALLREMHG